MNGKDWLRKVGQCLHKEYVKGCPSCDKSKKDYEAIVYGTGN